jgi:hypothetical protein
MEAEDAIEKARLRKQAFEDLVSFVEHFELVFGNDWGMTRSCIANADMIAADGTFLEPGVDDESNNWSNRGGLLAAYRKVRASLDAAYFKSFFGD